MAARSISGRSWSRCSSSAAAVCSRCGKGSTKIAHPEPVEHVWIGIIILGVSFLLEGSACLSNIKELKARAKGKPFMRYLRQTTDSDLVVVFGENSAAVLGLFFAFIAARARVVDRRWPLGRHRQRRDRPRPRRCRDFPRGRSESSLLTSSEAAPEEITTATHAIAKEFTELEQVLNVVTMQQGPERRGPRPREVGVHSDARDRGGVPRHQPV